MTRCGCGRDTCSCTFDARTPYVVDGDGTPDDPVIVSRVGDSVAHITVIDTPSVNLDISGSGTVANPYVLTGTSDPVVAEAVISTQIFLESGTWTKPATGQLCIVEVTAGGGGGSGARRKTASNSYPAFGIPGGGGGMSRAWFLLSELGATEIVTVGAGGSGGIGESYGVARGVGVAGQNSSFGNWVKAGGGHWGSTNLFTGLFSGKKERYIAFGTEYGNYYRKDDADGKKHDYAETAGGQRGGSGYGYPQDESPATVVRAAQDGGFNHVSLGWPGVGGVTNGDGGDAFSSYGGYHSGGSGGGGGGQSTSIVGRFGGDGAVPGGGGGSGSACTVIASNNKGGMGGRGADGMVRIRTW